MYTRAERKAKTTGRYCVYFIQFSFARVRFCSEGVSDERLGGRMRSQPTVNRNSCARNFILRIFVKQRLSVHSETAKFTHHSKYCHVLGCVVTYKANSGLDYWIY
jgi:hypothetical protein